MCLPYRLADSLWYSSFWHVLWTSVYSTWKLNKDMWMHYFFTSWHGVILPIRAHRFFAERQAGDTNAFLGTVYKDRFLGFVTTMTSSASLMHQQNNCSALAPATSNRFTRWSLEWVPALTRASCLMPLALGLQIITHSQAQLMRTNPFQCHLTAFLSKEKIKNSWAGPGGPETQAKLTVLKPLACVTRSLRLNMAPSPLHM